MEHTAHVIEDYERQERELKSKLENLRESRDAFIDGMEV